MDDFRDLRDTREFVTSALRNARNILTQDYVGVVRVMRGAHHAKEEAALLRCLKYDGSEFLVEKTLHNMRLDYPNAKLRVNVNQPTGHRIDDNTLVLNTLDLEDALRSSFEAMYRAADKNSTVGYISRMLDDIGEIYSKNKQIRANVRVLQTYFRAFE